MDRYNARVPLHRYSINFVPVADKTSSNIKETLLYDPSSAADAATRQRHHSGVMINLPVQYYISSTWWKFWSMHGMLLNRATTVWLSESCDLIRFVQIWPDPTKEYYVSYYINLHSVVLKWWKQHVSTPSISWDTAVWNVEYRNVICIFFRLFIKHKYDRNIQIHWQTEFRSQYCVTVAVLHGYCNAFVIIKQYRKNLGINWQIHGDACLWRVAFNVSNSDKVSTLHVVTEPSCTIWFKLQLFHNGAAEFRKRVLRTVIFFWFGKGVIMLTYPV